MAELSQSIFSRTRALINDLPKHGLKGNEEISSKSLQFIIDLDQKMEQVSVAYLRYFEMFEVGESG